jgi:hypothetical protein
MKYLKWLRWNIVYAVFLLALANVAHASWKIDSTGLSGQCALVSPVLKINDGQGETKIQLILNKEQLLVTTDSNIDNTMKDIGLKVDDKAFIYITEVINTTHVVFGKDRIDEIISQFVPGRRVLIHLRFWPTWPATGVKTAEFSLIGFTKTLTSLSQC